MSRGAQETRAALLAELARELRQFNGLSASYFRAAAGRAGMNVTDLEVIEMLESSGPMTAGQLADLTALTTGAITGMLNRLEEAGVVRRERDPNDGRRVIVRLVSDEGKAQATSGVAVSIGKAWDELAARYDDEQLALLVEFLRSSNAISQQEILRLREAPEGAEGVFSAPLGDLRRARLVFSAGMTPITLRADAGIPALYQAHFDGPAPTVKAEDGGVTVRYPRRLWFLDDGQRQAEITLNASIPWQITLQSKASVITADLRNLDLTGLEIKGGYGVVRLDLPAPSGVVPIKISGGASDLRIQRPAGVAARVSLKGWVSQLTFDDRSIGNAGNEAHLQSANYDTSAERYDIETTGYAVNVTITSG